MEQTRENKQVIFKAYIDRAPAETDMELRIGTVAATVPKGSGMVLLKNLYLSCDPYMRGRMRDFRDSYIHPFTPGETIEGFGVSEVIDSDNTDFRPGDFVTGMIPWEEYSLIRQPDKLKKIEHGRSAAPLSYHIGLFGMPGFTAYVGLKEICCPKEGETVLVSAASGAVGQIVGQLAKLEGCYVVGSAGSKEKVKLLKEKLGFDDAFVYKEEQDLVAALKRHFPRGIDVYFDNVGGEMLDAALLNMNAHGRIAVCGMVSLHGVGNPIGIHNLYNLVFKRINMKGFVQSDYAHLMPQFLEEMTAYYEQGKIKYVEDVRHGLENAAAAFVGLFSGRNVGKQVISVSST
ncbi:hypothetical protein MLD38_016839 [Melastoma candidum]|uniref:Uncharacterized protein n=1 Tax=Melastoma candidum TaxID=119954 RepID=A0ACB9QNM2_9MYRT|nr:hypothetical protein MLD38_016839 [Melastoma candidum]